MNLLTQTVHSVDVSASLNATRGFQSNALSLVMLVWVVCCLAYAAWRHATGRFLTLAFFAGASLPVMLAAVISPESIYRPWRISTFDSAFVKLLEAAITVAIGAAVGVIWARLAATIHYPNMDSKLLRSDDSTRKALHLVGSFGLAGSYLGWQSVTLVCLLTGLLSASIYRLAQIAGRSHSNSDWSLWAWVAMILYDLLRQWKPQSLHWLDNYNPAFSYTVIALLVLLLAKLTAVPQLGNPPGGRKLE